MALHSTLGTVWTLLRSPRTFFEERPPHRSFVPAFSVVLAFAVTVTVGFAAVGWWLASNIDATMTVTTVEPLPEFMCESANRTMNSTPVGCTIDEPRTEQVPVGPRVWDAVVRQLPFLFFAPFIYWLVVGFVLHALTAFYDGQGSFWGTLAVVGWSLVAPILWAVIVLFYVFVALHGVDFGGDAATVADQLEQSFGRLDSPVFRVGSTLATLLITCWQAYVWMEGLRLARNLRRHQAAVVAGVVAVGVLLLTLP